MQRNKHLHSAFAVLLALLVLSPFSFAGTNAIPAMAGILAELNHYPSGPQKETLAAISTDEANSEATQTIAKAIHNISHQPKPDDVAALKKLLDDESATDEEKQLASIVIGINHTPSAEVKKTLESLSK
jgi:hypothetical protein